MKKVKRFAPRSSQVEILKYRSGYMGISAVPGSGKTQTLSALAVELIASGMITDEQEILVVTMTNSAVENFRQRIQSLLYEKGLLSSFGYRVRTLHSLALDIVRERPDLANLSDKFVIIDAQESASIIDQIVTNYLSTNQEVTRLYSANDYLNNDSVKHFKDWKWLLVKTMPSFIKQAKDLHYTPAILQNLMAELSIDEPALNIAISLYSQYQEMLAYRSAVDFDDMIRYCDIVLDSDPTFLERLRRQWPYVLEDEAQDSSRLQEIVLQKIVGQNGNWVRVGDPNQAIYESFTTANPQFLTDFLEATNTLSLELPHSGRSSKSIINLANHLISWSNSSSNPNPNLKGALREPYILTTPPGDPQPNPEDHPEYIYVQNMPLSSIQETHRVIQSLVNWSMQGKQETLAVLTPDNKRGIEIVEELRKKNVDVVEFLRTNQDERDITQIIASIYAHLDKPLAPHEFSNLYDSCRDYLFPGEINKDIHSEIVDVLYRYYPIERLLYPQGQAERDEVLALFNNDSIQYQYFADFSHYVRQWHSAATLPPDQFVLSQLIEFCRTKGEIDYLQKLSQYLNRYMKTHVSWSFGGIALELNTILTSRISINNNRSDENSFDPDEHRGKVVVTTMHKAKGLEWDRVYLLSLNNYDFPFDLPGDSFMGEYDFVKDDLNFEIELTSKLVHLHNNDINQISQWGEATRAARTQYASERIRLFFVGITRAKQALSMTWNTGRHKDKTMSESLKSVSEYLSASRNSDL